MGWRPRFFSFRVPSADLPRLAVGAPARFASALAWLKQSADGVATGPTRPPLAKINASRSRSTSALRSLPSCPPINRDHACEHERKSEFCFEVGNETRNPRRRGPRPNQTLRHGLRSNSQKAKSQSRLRKSPSRYFWHLPSTQPGFVLSPPAEKSTPRQNQTEKNVADPFGRERLELWRAKYCETVLTLFY
jgi:hypothetical protein